MMNKKLKKQLGMVMAVMVFSASAAMNASAANTAQNKETPGMIEKAEDIQRGIAEVAEGVQTILEGGSDELNLVIAGGSDALQKLIDLGANELHELIELGKGELKEAIAGGAVDLQETIAGYSGDAQDSVGEFSEYLQEAIENLLDEYGYLLETGDSEEIYAEEGETDYAVEASPVQMILSFDSNRTTGYEWHGFVLSGDSVALDTEDGIYVEDDNPEMMDGVGGTTYFQLCPIKPGDSIVTFDYTRGWENEPIESSAFLVTVDDQMKLECRDITESGMINGIVTDVKKKTRTILMDTEKFGEIEATFDDDIELPAPGEEICIYTNGAMTASLPGMVNVLAWKSMASALAR